MVTMAVLELIAVFWSNLNSNYQKKKLFCFILINDTLWMPLLCSVLSSERLSLKRSTFAPAF